MKLPTNKKERVQILVLIGVGVVVVLYLLIQMGIRPLIASYRQSRDQLEKKCGELDAKNKDLARRPRLQKEHEEINARIDEYTAKYILKPKLSSYRIVAQEYLDAVAAQNDVKLENFSEIGITEMLGKGKDGSKLSLRSYGVRVSGNAGFRNLTRLLEQIEKDNTMVCVGEMVINARAASPERHQISLTFYWPIWGEPDDDKEEKPAARRRRPAAPKEEM